MHTSSLQFTVERVRCRDLCFKTTVTGSMVLMWVSALRPCSVSGVRSIQQGRAWVLDTAMTEAQVVNTCLLAALTFEEHELREEFQYLGERPFMPTH